MNNTISAAWVLAELSQDSVPEGDVLLVEFPPANAIKATIPRLQGSGAVEDSDVYGAQQHGPLIEWRSIYRHQLSKRVIDQRELALSGKPRFNLDGITAAKERTR